MHLLNYSWMKTLCWFGAKLGFWLCLSSLIQAFFPPLSLMQLVFCQGRLCIHLGVTPPTTFSLFLLDMLWASIHSAIDSLYKLDDSTWYWATRSIYAKTNRCLFPCLAPTTHVARRVTLNMGKYCSLSPEEAVDSEISLFSSCSSYITVQNRVLEPCHANLVVHIVSSSRESVLF